jgi:hypothetical protein
MVLVDSVGIDLVFIGTSWADRILDHNEGITWACCSRDLDDGQLLILVVKILARAFPQVAAATELP